MYSRYTYHKYSFEYLVDKLTEQNAEENPHDTYPGVYMSNVSYNKENHTLYTNSGSILHSNGLLEVNLENFSDREYCRYIIDGLGLFVYFNDKQKSHYSPFHFGYHTVKDIYNLYTNRTFQGYVGQPSSHYNRILVSERDLLHRHYNGHATIIKEPYFTVHKESKTKGNRPFHNEYTVVNDSNLALIFEWRNVWRHVPMWESSPRLYLKDALRIIALHLVTLRLEYKRDLFIGICHKSKLSKGRVLLFSYLGKKLSSLKVPPEIIKLVKNTLREFGGYTSNAYFTWYYLPVIEPIEYSKLFNKASEAYNSLPGVIIHDV